MAVPLSPARLARRWSAILWVAVCALVALPITVLAPAAAVAQDAGNAPGNINFASWEADAGRAEATLEADRASTLALEQLRAQIVDWRTRFSAAVSANAARIATQMSRNWCACASASIRKERMLPCVGCTRSSNAAK